MVGIPSGITEVEERAVEEAILRAGAREVYLIEEPMAAAIGADLDVAEPAGNIIVDIGGGTTEVAVISLGGAVVSNSTRVAGDELDIDIMDYIKKEMGLAIGVRSSRRNKKRDRLCFATCYGKRNGSKRERFSNWASKKHYCNFEPNTRSNGRFYF